MAYKPMTPQGLDKIARSLGLDQLANQSADKGYSAIARICGVSRSCVGRWADGSRSIPPPAAKLLRLVKRQRLSVERVLHDTDTD